MLEPGRNAGVRTAAKQSHSGWHEHPLPRHPVSFMIHRLKPTLLFLSVLLAASSLPAQNAAAPTTPGTRRPIDRIVAIVGTTPILWSEVTEAVNQRRAMGAQIPEDSAAAMAFAHDILDQLVDEELLVQRATADTTITV